MIVFQGHGQPGHRPEVRDVDVGRVGLAGSGPELVGLLRVMAPALANWLGATTVVWLSTSCLVVLVLSAKEVVPL